ncbi:MAG TPA: hypothetical protein VK168_09325 [Saprospiraceae bacterium]|nr:hypothetical protein [Saprospiraceae bacterium]
MNTQSEPISDALLQEMQQWITQYYTGLKPSISNASGAFQAITVRENGQLQAFCLCYENPSFPEYLMLGNYQCTTSGEAAAALFQEADKTAGQRGKKHLLGPMNGSTWHAHRFTENLKTPYFLEFIHLPYYPQQWVEAGFEVEERYVSQEAPLEESLIPPVDDEAFFQQKGISFRPFSADALAPVHAFCNEVFAQNNLFSPIAQDAFIALYQPVLPILDPELIDLAYDGDQLAGLFFAVPDIYQPGRVIVKTLARHPADKYKGMAQMLSVRFLKKALKKGFNSMIHAYMHVENRSNHVSTNFGGGDNTRHHVLFRR